MANNKSLYLKASEVAATLDMDVSTIYKLCAENILPSIRVGEKAVRIPRAAFNAYLARQERGHERRRPMLAEARQVESDPISTLEHQAQSFYERAGCSAHQFAEQWRQGRVDDTPETASLLIEALSLREALDRAGIGDRVLA
jgi:excisionase family DNA binding protein